MGSKMIMFFGVLASLLYLYFCLNTKGDIFPKANEVAITQEELQESEDSSVKEEKEEKSTDVSNTEKTSLTPPIQPVQTTPAASETSTQVGVSDRTPAAFGFMTGSKNQVVGLMSLSDKDGKLAKKVESLCGENNCNKDMRFEKDILEASWQDETVQIVELLTNGGIENGSLFIEDNVLKLEGTVKDKKTESVLASILKSAENKAFKIETHTNVSITKTAPKDITHSVNNVKKVTEKVDLPLAKTKPVEVEAKPKVKQVTKHVPKTVIKTVRKKIVKKQHVLEKEIVPAAVMETTLDVDARVRAILNDIKSSKPAVGMVAKPHMETTNERY
jgi:hypothetical protein